MSDDKRIMATLDAYADAYCAKDLERLMAIFVDGEQISLIGTGADEFASGRDAVASVFARNFREATATRFEWKWVNITTHGMAGTVAATLDIHLEADHVRIVVPVRWTVSLVKTRNQWLWVHRHASCASMTQKDGAAYPGGAGNIS